MNNKYKNIICIETLIPHQPAISPEAKTTSLIWETITELLVCLTYCLVQHINVLSITLKSFTGSSIFFRNYLRLLTATDIENDDK